MYFFFSVAKMQVTVVTSLSEKYHCCYKLYQIIQTTHSFFQLCTYSGMCLLYSLLCHVIQFFLYFTLTKDGVNVIVYMTCLYLLLLKKKKKIMPQLPCYLSFLLGRGGKSLRLKPCQYFKKLKVHLLTLKSRRRTCLDLQCIGDAPQNCPTL